jgi:hypothetical protein
VVARQSDGTVGVILNQGNGSFAAPLLYPVGLYPSALAAGDVTGDGKPDLVVSIAQQGTGKVLVFENLGDGTFAPPVAHAVGPYPYSLALADVNGDGKLDIATGNSEDDTVSVLFNQGYGAFGAFASYPAGSEGQGVSGLTAVDLNGDGMPELVFFADGMRVLVNAGDGTFQPALTYLTGLWPFAVAVADVDGDGKPDLAVLNTNTNDVTVLRTTCIE